MSTEAAHTPGETDQEGATDATEIPMLGVARVHPVPDLRRVPRERWREVLASTHRSVREESARTALWIDVASGIHANELLLEITVEENAARERAAQAATRPGPLPSPRPAAHAGRRQISFRMSASEYADVLRAADILGLRPTQVARLLTLRGVNQVLREALG